MLEGVGGGGMGAEELALGTRVCCRALSKETALTWIYTFQVISLQNWEAIAKVDGIKKKKNQDRDVLRETRRELLESGYVQVSV